MEKGTLTKPWKKQWVFLCLILCHRCISDTSELARSDWKCRILIPPRLRDNQSLMKGKCWIPSILPSPRKPVGCVMQTNLIQESAFFCLLLFLVLVHVQTHIQRERKMEKKRERERPRPHISVTAAENSWYTALGLEQGGTARLFSHWMAAEISPEPSETKYSMEDENQGMLFFYCLRQGGGETAINCSWEKQMAVY